MNCRNATYTCRATRCPSTQSSFAGDCGKSAFLHQIEKAGPFEVYGNLKSQMTVQRKTANTRFDSGGSFLSICENNFAVTGFERRN
jgi:hypothetical protein